MYEEKKSGNGLIIAIIIVLLVIMIGAVGVVLYITMGLGGGSLDKHVENGQAYLKDGDYDEAIEEFEEALEIDPMYIAIYKGLSDAYIGLDDYESAIAVLEEAKELYDDEGDKDSSKKISKLLEKVKKEAARHGVDISTETTETADPADVDGPEGDGTDAGGSTVIDPGAGDVEEAPVDPSMNEQELKEYYDSLVSRNNTLPEGETFEAAGKYVAASGDRTAYVGLNSDVTGYINYIFYDFDMDDVNELVMTYYNRDDYISVEVVDIVDGTPKTIFNYSEIMAYLGGLNPYMYPQLATEAASVSVGLCEKDGTMYIVSRNDGMATIFDTKVMCNMHIYEVNGNSATEVFTDYLIGKNYSEFSNDSTMMDAYRGFPDKLRALGFYDTADNLDFELRFASSEGITPLVFACSRHSCMFDSSFNVSSLKKNKSNGNPGVRAFVFASTESEGYSIMDSQYPIR